MLARFRIFFVDGAAAGTEEESATDTVRGGNSSGKKLWIREFVT